MNKRLPFIPTAIIFILSFLVCGAFFVWLTVTFNLPDWVMTIGEIFFLLFIFEIPARIGPKPFDTFLSKVSRLSKRDKQILLLSFGLFVGYIVYIDGKVAQFSGLEKLVPLILLMVIAIGPILLFGSPEAGKSVFRGD